MKRIEDILRCVLLLAAIALLISLAAAALAVRHAARQAERDELQLAPQISSAIGKIAAAPQIIDSRLKPVTDDVHTLISPGPRGILNATQNVLSNWAAPGKVAAQVLVEEREAYKAQNKTVTDLGASATRLLDSANGEVGDLRTTQQQLTAILKAVDPASISRMQAHAENITAQADQTSVVVHDIAGHFDKMAADGDAMTGDARSYVHRFTHPTKKQAIVSFTESAILAGIRAW